MFSPLEATSKIVSFNSYFFNNVKFDFLKIKSSFLLTAMITLCLISKSTIGWFEIFIFLSKVQISPFSLLKYIFLSYSKSVGLNLNLYFFIDL